MGESETLKAPGPGWRNNMTRAIRFIMLQNLIAQVLEHRSYIKPYLTPADNTLIKPAVCDDLCEHHTFHLTSPLHNQ